MNIAIVEDEPKLAKVLEDYLQKAEYHTQVYTDGQVALDAISASPPDLILLDLMLPGLDGMSLCREVRKTSQVPIIMMTARAEEMDRLQGLETGADDYICKPYSPREVVARVKAVLRRSVSTEPVLESSLFQLNESAACAIVNGQQCELTAVELRLLKVMSASPGQVFNRSQLMSRMYTDQRIVSDRTIDSHVKKLRQKLDRLDSAHEFIHSVYGLGYKFEVVEIP